MRYNQHNRMSKRKSKVIKGNESKIAFISFYLLFKIEAFQWVTADSNKKIRRRLNFPLRLNWALQTASRLRPHLLCSRMVDFD